jgi:hypothetical protein
MLTGIHFLLTYSCTSECDHCFLYCSPRAKGTFTLGQLKVVFDEIAKIGTIEAVYFEGGEPFLFYPLMLEGIKLAGSAGLKAGIVSNAYWATTVEDAEIWLSPLAEAGLSSLSLSDDAFHHDQEQDSPARKALEAAKKLRIPVNTICIEKPTVMTTVETEEGKGTSVIGGGALFKGRAVEKLTQGLPRRPFTELVTCPHEELEQPKRVHLDAFGHVHLCQGLSMGNMWETPLSELVKNYDALAHPVCKPLVKGGPALLAETYGVAHEPTYVDECHFCYLVRLALIDRFPQYLAPRQVYGLD